ncbi:hypothetical protein PIB30_053786 [Stylosanthes scabra]|uniref:Uncharacterized protein n=1 Tax=Stylosanthes scabra TaxID=79078 RepID=A0ABU6WIG2_9FABA|nr:hypothetical protein [Stylosanthes scabra]
MGYFRKCISETNRSKNRRRTVTRTVQRRRRDAGTGRPLPRRRWHDLKRNTNPSQRRRQRTTAVLVRRLRGPTAVVDGGSGGGWWQVSFKRYPSSGTCS